MCPKAFGQFLSFQRQRFSVACKWEKKKSIFKPKIKSKSLYWVNAVHIMWKLHMESIYPKLNDNFFFLKHSHIKWHTLNTILFPFFFPHSNPCCCQGHNCGPPKTLKVFIQKKIMLFFSLKIRKMLHIPLPRSHSWPCCFHMICF